MLTLAKARIFILKAQLAYAVNKDVVIYVVERHTYNMLINYVPKENVKMVGDRLEGISITGLWLEEA